MIVENIWVLECPDNGHWDESFAEEEIARLAKVWDVVVTPTGVTRDMGFGQERLYVVEGEEENIKEFDEGLEEALY